MQAPPTGAAALAGKAGEDPSPDVTRGPSCLHRDLLPFTLRLPQAILEAGSFMDLETISNLGLGKSSPREGKQAAQAAQPP